jgi:hypothetical protein
MKLLDMNALIAILKVQGVQLRNYTTTSRIFEEGGNRSQLADTRYTSSFVENAFKLSKRVCEEVSPKFIFKATTCVALQYSFINVNKR